MVETLVWLVTLVGIGVLLWRGGGYRIVGIVALLVAGAVAERRYRAARTKVSKTEREAADAFSAKTVHRVRDRRARLREARQAREELQRLEEEYAARQKDRAGRVADLWNDAFGRSSVGRGADSHGEDGDGVQGGGGGDDAVSRPPGASRRGP